MIRAEILRGVEAGQNPRETALSLAGRLNRATGRREGGLVGLTTQQAEYVASARAQLASGDPAAMREYLGRGRRDKRYDRMVLKAINAQKPVAKADLDRIAARYSDNLLALRAETIARNESLAALHAGQAEAIQQLIDSGKVRADQITKEWSSTGDGRTRDSHLAMDGQAVKWGRPFTTPRGALLQYPSDVSLGAPPSETIQCRCFMQVRIDYLR